jgi:hypothetical protein
MAKGKGKPKAEEVIEEEPVSDNDDSDDEGDDAENVIF